MTAAKKISRRRRGRSEGRENHLLMNLRRVKRNVGRRNAKGENPFLHQMSLLPVILKMKRKGRKERRNKRKEEEGLQTNS